MSARRAVNPHFVAALAMCLLCMVVGVMMLSIGRMLLGFIGMFATGAWFAVAMIVKREARA